MYYLYPNAIIKTMGELAWFMALPEKQNKQIHN